MNASAWSIVSGFAFGVGLVLAVAFCKVALHLSLLN